MAGYTVSFTSSVEGLSVATAANLDCKWVRGAVNNSYNFAVFYYVLDDMFRL
jgi:hypothetical protein